MSNPELWGNEFLVNTTTAGNQRLPSVAALANGQFVASWSSGGTAMVRVYHADGTPASGEIVVSQNAPDCTAVTGLSDGRFAVVWRDGTGSASNIAARIYNHDGTPAGAQISVTDAAFAQMNPSVAPLGAGFVVTWEHHAGAGDWDIRARRFDASGVPLANEASIDANSITEDHPVVARLPGDYYVVAWVDAGSVTETDGSGSHIRAQVFRANGIPETDEFIVNTTTTGNQTDPAITVLSNGSFAASWRDPAAGGQIRTRTFDMHGVASGNDVVVDGSNRSDPAIAALDDGGFFLADTDATPGVASIHAMTIAASGQFGEGIALGGSGAQHSPAAAKLADGRVVVLWTDVGQNPGDMSGDAVRGQILEVRDHGGDLIGTALDDELVGTELSDTFRGGAGDDILTGGGGANRAVFSGDLHDYAIVRLGNGDVHVIDQRPGSPDGSDTLRDMTLVRFGQMDFLLSAVVIDKPMPFGDLLWQHRDGTLAAAGHDIGVVSNGWQVHGTGDFDGDGDSDILLRQDSGLTFTWELEDGHHLATQSLGTVPASWRIAGTGDFDHDGDDDILWRNTSGGQVTTWEMEDGQYVVNHNHPVVGNSWQVAGTGDFDADGDDDILWRNSNGTVVSWEMENGQYVVNHNYPQVGNSWQIRAVGDFDGDHDADLVWTHDNGAMSMWEMQDSSYVVNHNLHPLPSGWQVVGSCDTNNDGTDDYLYRHTDGRVLVEAAGVTGFMAPVSSDWQIRGTGEFGVL